MKFSKGQVVIHPHHGPATITAITTRKIKNASKKYLKLDVHDPQLSVRMPLERAEEIGVRSVISKDGVRELFDIFTGPSGPTDSVWSRRMKNNTSLLRTGDVQTIAGLVRDLIRRNEEKRLSFGEMSLLREAMGPITAELAIVLKVTADEAEEAIRAAVIDDVKPKLTDTALAAAS